LLKNDAGDIAGRPRQARNIAMRKWVEIDCRHHNWYCPGGANRGLECNFGPKNNENIRLAGHELLHGVIVVIRSALQIDKVHRIVLTFDVPQLAHPNVERLQKSSSSWLRCATSNPKRRRRRLRAGD
jgi:hypothetical protein